MKKIKILMILGDLKFCNGISSYAMNYYKYLNSENIQMDFVLTKGGIDKEYEELIKTKGGKIFVLKITKTKDIIKNIKNIKNLMKEEHYEIVHTHVINLGYFFLKYAKKYGIKNRILHSHTVLQREKNILKELRNEFFIKLVNSVANIRFACSDDAGKSLFDKKEYRVINNAIEIEKYLFNIDIRREKRKEYNLEDKLVIGHIGRFSKEKNQEFIIELFKKIYNENTNTKLILIGEGPMKEEIVNKVKEYNLEKSVIFLGQVENVWDFLQMMDIFIFPSLLEGVGIAALEAQTNGLTTILSNRVPKITKVIDTTKFLQLDNIEAWKNEILSNKIVDFRDNKKQQLIDAGFDIKTEAKKLELLYKELAKN